MSEELEPYAAIDLGSNSFHMIVANYVDGRAIVVDRLKEMVRLAGGLDENNNLSDEAMDRAILCLEKFGQRIKTIPLQNVRAVGTNTLRLARNGMKFMHRANAALGHRIEIISGREEARLIYLGVANTMFNETDYRLVIDIGGGSTEFIIGKGFQANVTESLFMGCVSISKQFFADGTINGKLIRKANISALQELSNIADEYKTHGWDIAIGASGTIKAIQRVVTERGWSKDTITPEALYNLRKTLIEFGHVDNIDFNSLSSGRKPVFTGGVIVLSAIFEALGINEMHYSDGALREGLLHDQIGRRHDHDVREKTVARISKRYSVDEEQAARLEQTVITLFNALEQNWKLNRQTDLKMLRWAARLHEIGLAIAHSQYHKHGEYILGNSDMPGFSRQEQQILSVLVRAHRRKFPLETFATVLDEEHRNKLIQMSIILRLAVLLNRGRELVNESIMAIGVKKESISLDFKGDWLARNPLTEADLNNEINYLAVTNYKLKFSGGSQENID
ncbi:MAG: exopolyphosphatase [Gammaproteobacteria bacterium]